MGQFTRPPIIAFSDVDTAVTPGGNTPGYVSATNGKLAGLAASAATRLLFDLGPNWVDYPILALQASFDGLSIGLNPVIVEFDDSSTYSAVSATRRRGVAVTVGTTLSTAYFNWTAANAYTNATFKPQARYMYVNITNADGVASVGASSRLNVIMYPN